MLLKSSWVFRTKPPKSDSLTHFLQGVGQQPPRHGFPFLCSNCPSFAFTWGSVNSSQVESAWFYTFFLAHPQNPTVSGHHAEARGRPLLQRHRHHPHLAPWMSRLRVDARNLARPGRPWSPRPPSNWCPSTNFLGWEILFP